MQPASSSSSNALTVNFTPLTAAEETEEADTIQPSQAKRRRMGAGHEVQPITTARIFSPPRYHHHNSKNSSLDRPQSPSSSGALAIAADASPSPSQMLPTTLDIALDIALDTMARDMPTEELETVFAWQQAFENRRRDPLGLDLDEFLDSLLEGLMTSPT